MRALLDELLNESDSNVVTIVSNMKKSLYVQYVEEREAGLFIEHEHGFAIYKIAPDHVYLQDIFVVPEKRQSGLGVRLMDEVILEAKKLGYDRLIGSVVPSTEFSDNMMKIMQGLDFKILSSSDDIIYLIKEI